MLLKARHFAQYKDIGALLVKHGRSSQNRRSDSDEAGEGSEASRRDAEKLATDLEGMGPTFVKLGQLLSTRADLLPAVYLKALSRLQDRVEPFAFEEVERIVTAELGVKLSEGFASFDREALASASLGQVHRAELPDGRSVVVKVQRPDIRAQIVDDMDAVESIAEFADAHTDAGRRLGFVDMVAEFRSSLMAELDYRKEAKNLEMLGRNLSHRSRIVVPQPISDYSTGVVLTMDYVSGRNVGTLKQSDLGDSDGHRLASELFSAYLDQILVDGFFHADPHPGNVLVTDEGKLGLLDLGMVARVAPEMQDSLIKLLLAVSQGYGQEAASVAVEIGQKLDGYDQDRFFREAVELITRNHGSTIEDIQAGAVVSELTRISGGCGLRLPSELTMLGKALLNLDEVVRVLDPAFDPNAAIQREGTDLMRRKMSQAASPGNIIAAAMEAKEFAERFPGRVNKVMDALAEGELKLRVQGIDEQDIMRSVQKLANRVTSGVVIASLVIGAALIMRIPTSSRLFGYPALAIVLFLLAAGSAAWLLISIQLSDLPQRRRSRRK